MSTNCICNWLTAQQHLYPLEIIKYLHGQPVPIYNGTHDSSVKVHLSGHPGIGVLLCTLNRIAWKDRP